MLSLPFGALLLSENRVIALPTLAQSFLGIYYNSISWFYVLTHESTELWNSAWTTFPSLHEQHSKRSAESTVLCSDRYSLRLANFICRAIKLALEMDRAAAGLSCWPLTGEVPGRKLVQFTQRWRCSGRTWDIKSSKDSLFPGGKKRRLVTPGCRTHCWQHSAQQSPAVPGDQG